MTSPNEFWNENSLIFSRSFKIPKDGQAELNTKPPFAMKFYFSRPEISGSHADFKGRQEILSKNIWNKEKNKDSLTKLKVLQPNFYLEKSRLKIGENRGFLGHFPNGKCDLIRENTRFLLKNFHTLPLLRHDFHTMQHVLHHEKLTPIFKKLIRSFFKIPLNFHFKINFASQNMILSEK